MTHRDGPKSADPEVDPFAVLRAAGAAGSEMEQIWDAIDALSCVDQSDGSVSDATLKAVKLALDVLLSDQDVQTHHAKTLRSKVAKYRTEGNLRAAAYFERELADWEGSA